MTAAQYLLKCPTCAAPLPSSGYCSACEADYRKLDILDFVGGAFHTKLDESSYTELHNISLERSDITFKSYRKVLGERLPDSIGNVIEIGCGTGGFTTGLLQNTTVANAVLTDVSPQMLHLCRQRLDKYHLSDSVNLILATYSGNEDCIQDSVFDWCFGASVVHHILDVPAFFKDVKRWLKVDGRAMFIEPCLRYQWALVLTATDTAAALLAQNTNDDAAMQILNWIAIARYALVHADDLSILSRIEDKHLFSSEYIHEVALSSGFTNCECIRFGPNDRGMEIFPQYLQRLGINGERVPDIMDLMAGIAPKYFNILHPSDQGPLYVIYLEAGPADAAPAVIASDRILEPRALSPRPRAHLTASWQEGRLLLGGWVCCPVAVRRLVAQVDGKEYIAPVWLPRPDVHRIINDKYLYSAVNAIFSGISEVFEHEGQQGEIRISIDTVEGHHVSLGQIPACGNGELAV